MENFDAVVFDLGSTLFEKRDSVKKANMKRFEEAKTFLPDLTEEEYFAASEKVAEYFGDKYHGDCRRFMSGIYVEEMLDFLNYDLSKWEIQYLGFIFWSEMVEKQTKREMADKIIDFCLKNDLKLGVITNGNYLMTKNRLDKLEHDSSVFEEVIYSTEVMAEKSELKPFEVFLDRTDLEAEKCLMVGDRPDEDILAEKVGMKTALLETDNDRNLDGRECSEPDFVLENLVGLKEILN